MSNKKERAGEMLEKYLPRLQDKDPEYVRECLSLIIRRLELKQFKLAVQEARNPLEFGYNLYLWTQGLAKEVRKNGKFTKGKTYREKRLSWGYTEDEINDPREGGPYKSGAYLQVGDTLIPLGNKPYALIRE